MGSHSFPAHMKGREARPAIELATIYPSTEGGVQIDWSSDRAAEVAAELGFAAEDLAGMQGTGRGGSITVADVKNWGKEPE